jgi:hypothetical protein
MMSEGAAKRLVDVIEAFVAARNVFERLRNPESEAALDKARSALVDLLERE